MKKVIRTLGLSLLMVMIALMYALPCSAAKARDASNSVVMVYEQFTTLDNYGNPEKASAYGSGFAIGEVGKPVQYIVTNYHVIADAYTQGSDIEVFFSVAANRMVHAEVYWKNEQKDLAVLRLPEPTTERQALVLCPESKVNMDDTFTALGYPYISMVGSDFPKFDVTDITTTRGGIAKLTRVSETDCYQIDIDISGGNSGGPLVNSKGEVIGINSFYIKQNSGSDVRANYAIAIDELINNINRNIIPISIAGEFRASTLFFFIGGACLLIILAAVIVFVLIGRNKKGKGKVRKGAAKPGAESIAPVSARPTAKIFGVSGYLQGKSFSLESTLKFGRDSNTCNVVFPIDHPGISGSHCVVSADANGVSLTDLGSSYGTFLSDGQKLTPNQAVKLQDGDTFYLADEVNKFLVRTGL